jgi:hypothetical protein
MQPTIDPAAAYDQLKSAVVGAQVNTAPGASPLGSFPELSKLYGSSFEVPISNANAGADSANTDITVSNQKAAAAAAKSAAADAQDNPNKYKQVLKPDGGYAFYDNNGNEITAAQYAAARNEDVTKVLGNSYNPIDKAFVQDYKQLQQYINDKANAKNDATARSRAQTVETQVRKLYGIQLHQQNPNQVINAFIQAYPTVYGGTAAGKQGTSTLFPTANTLKSSSKSLGASGL